MPQQLRSVQVQHDFIRLDGGFDLLTPTLSLKPGALRDTLNYECSVTGGYTRIPGYERADGRPAPSDATFTTIDVSALGALIVGNTINGQTSGATGVVIAIDTLRVAFTKATGTFQVGENVRIGAVVIGTATAVPGILTDARTVAMYNNLAADVYRADIAAVPGSGPVRGVAYYGGNLYAWRDNAGSTALVMFKATTGGWATVNLGLRVAFTAGQAAGIAVGDTVTGFTSGASGVVVAVVVQSGAFATNNAAGFLVFNSITGTFQAAESLRVGGTNRATCSGAQTATTLLPGGRVTTDQGSFGGASNARAKLYGADGVNKGFEFDGTAYVPITTGMTADTPDRVKVHQRHLFFAFDSSVQHSGLGTPYVWSVLFGAGELALDDVITDWVEQPGAQTTGALVIYCRNSTMVLYGTSSADWNLARYQQETGGIAYTAQVVGSAYVLDDRGVIELSTTQAYGNFADATLTANIRPWLQTRRNRAVGSAVNREKNQYRLFFSDGSGLYVTIVNGKMKGAMPVAFPHPASCATNGETPDGAETNFFGGTNGFVYRLDAGTSFDGDSISATALLNFATQGDSRMRKRYRKGSIEIQGSSYAEIQVGYSLSYADSTVVDQGTAGTYSNNFSAPYWDSFIWDAFTWDGLTLSPSEIEISGTAENIALRIDSNGDFFEPFTLNSLILHYTPRRGIR
jgi:hypothetical protein